MRMVSYQLVLESIDCNVSLELVLPKGDGVISRAEWIDIARSCEKKFSGAAVVKDSWQTSPRRHRG